MFTSALLHVLVIVVFQKKQISGQKYCEDDNVYFIKYFNKNLPAEKYADFICALVFFQKSSLYFEKSGQQTPVIFTFVSV